MNWDLVKKNISKEIAGTISTIDPAFDIEECLDIYLKILKYKTLIPTKNDLDGLEKSITDTLIQNFVDGQANDISIGLFCKNFEQFVKKIYYILEQSEFIDDENKLDHTKHLALLPFLGGLNKIRPIYLDEKNKEVYEVEIAANISGKPKFKINSQTGKKTYKKLYSSDIRFDDETTLEDKELNEKYPNSFLYYLIRSVKLKNEQSHQAPERSRLANIINLNSTLITELWIINFFRKELIIAIKKDSFRKKDFDEYIALEINRLKKQSPKFVSLNLKQLTDQSINGTNGFIEDLLKGDSCKMRILGQGGSGKTTTLEYLLYKDCLNWNENPLSSKIPVYISLANLSANETIVDAIASKLNVDNEDVEELFETNELILYLDGVNEIVINRESKKIKLQEISSLIDDYKQLSVIITDRFEFDSYQNNMFNIPTYIIQELSEDQIQEFVQKYCYNSADQTEHVLSVLKSKNSIKELLLRPLILTRAIEIIKMDNDLPEKEGQIIEKFIDTLLKREKDEKKDPLLNISSFKLLLSYAANEIYTKYKTNAPVHEFSFNKMLVDASEKYGLEKFNAGYISRIGYELQILSKTTDNIQFYHQSYLDYFCSHNLKYQIR